eukprot:3236439-Prymnesium_polylepis.1
MGPAAAPPTATLLHRALQLRPRAPVAAARVRVHARAATCSRRGPCRASPARTARTTPRCRCWLRP